MTRYVNLIAVGVGIDSVMPAGAIKMDPEWRADHDKHGTGVLERLGHFAKRGADKLFSGSKKIKNAKEALRDYLAKQAFEEANVASYPFDVNTARELVKANAAAWKSWKFLTAKNIWWESDINKVIGEANDQVLSVAGAHMKNYFGTLRESGPLVFNSFVPLNEQVVDGFFLQNNHDVNPDTWRNAKKVWAFLQAHNKIQKHRIRKVINDTLTFLKGIGSFVWGKMNPFADYFADYLVENLTSDEVQELTAATGLTDKEKQGLQLVQTWIGFVQRQDGDKQNRNGFGSGTKSTATSVGVHYKMIFTGLTEKVMDKIREYIVERAKKLSQEKEKIVTDCKQFASAEESMMKCAMKSKSDLSESILKGLVYQQLIVHRLVSLEMKDPELDFDKYEVLRTDLNQVMQSGKDGRARLEHLFPRPLEGANKAKAEDAERLSMIQRLVKLARA